MPAVFLGLGSNQAQRESHLASAVKEMGGLDAVRLRHVSGIYETEPWGVKNQPWFLNQAVQLDTALSPETLLGICRQIERSHNRVRRERWGPRTLDIDILLYGNFVICRPDLVIPHPRMLERRFVLVPLNEIASGFRIPGPDLSVSEALERCPDRHRVRPYVRDTGSLR